MKNVFNGCMSRLDMDEKEWVSLKIQQYKLLKKKNE